MSRKHGRIELSEKEKKALLRTKQCVIRNGCVREGDELIACYWCGRNEWDEPMYVNMCMKVVTVQEPNSYRESGFVILALVDEDKNE
jgi:hypothetical protein